MLSESTLHQYANMECNNYHHFPLINGKISSSHNLPVSTLTSPSITLKKIEVSPLKIQYTRRSSINILLKIKKYMFTVQFIQQGHR